MVLIPQKAALLLIVMQRGFDDPQWGIEITWMLRQMQPACYTPGDKRDGLFFMCSIFPKMPIHPYEQAPLVGGSLRKLSPAAK